MKWTWIGKRVVESHELSACSRLNLSSPRCNCGRGPLTNTWVSEPLRASSRSLKSCFRTSDWHLLMSLAPTCRTILLTLGCAARILGTFCFMLAIRSLGKQKVGVFLMFTPFKVKSHTIRVSGHSSLMRFSAPLNGSNRSRGATAAGALSQNVRLSRSRRASNLSTWKTNGSGWKTFVFGDAEKTDSAVPVLWPRGGRQPRGPKRRTGLSLTSWPPAAGIYLYGSTCTWQRRTWLTSPPCCSQDNFGF